jgi:hypothetical protein
VADVEEAVIPRKLHQIAEERPRQLVPAGFHLDRVTKV